MKRRTAQKNKSVKRKLIRRDEIVDSSAFLNDGIMSDSNDEIENSSDNPLLMDPIDGFSANEDMETQYEQNILDKLDDWTPYPEYEQKSEEYIDDIFSINSDSDSKNPGSIHSVIGDYQSDEDYSHPSQIAHSSVHPVPINATPITLNFIHESLRNANMPIKYKKDGLAAKAYKDMLSELDKFNQWERQVNAEMAILGSITNLHFKHEDMCLLRMIEPWMEQGLIFSWCILFKDHELRQLMDTVTPVSTVHTQEDDIIEDFSQPSSLPNYEPTESDNQILVAFSFAYMNPTLPKQKFLETEKWVAIWPPWTEMQIRFQDMEEDSTVLLMTRFKANSLY